MIIKLIRDKLTRDLKVKPQQLSQEDHVAFLRRKLMEEATEYLLNPSLEELADIYEVVLCLAIVDLKLSPKQLRAAAVLKEELRGSFMHGIGMVAEYD